MKILRACLVVLAIAASGAAFAGSSGMQASLPCALNPDGSCHYITGFTSHAYNGLTWPNRKFIVGGSFINGDADYVPVPVGGAASMVNFSGQVWVSAFGWSDVSGEPPNYVVKIFKNGTCTTGTPIPTAIGSKGTFPDSMILAYALNDRAEPGDTYRICLFATYQWAQVDANPLHSFMSSKVDPL
jgi:hypothetical protein